ncbi:hypothetical protein J2Z66_003716 [Paenibacillus eucommiae]|uniref:Uncharacterized protein n=1 Tax=Paenibacillus eucommiae TaxID=1355755 RepID=A0ABS4IWZ3_9BACL|nr:hypothetical protein [Paenibacillus eucommiae]
MVYEKPLMGLFFLKLQEERGIKKLIYAYLMAEGYPLLYLFYKDYTKHITKEEGLI